MRIAMIGTGYVGLVSGACIADFGHQVTCVDKDSAKISALNSGEIPIYEPGLKDIVQSNVRQGRLLFTTALSEALNGADAVFIAVGTPSRRGDGHADLSYVYEATREIAAALTDFTVIITKSTVPVGTGDEVERIIRELRPDIDVAVVSNPEFLREGAAIHDFKHPDRIVIGTDDERAKRVLTEIYRPLYLNQAPILYTGRRTAELIKYAANAFLATKITFINEIADLCEKLGADVQEVARALGSTRELGRNSCTRGPDLAARAFPRMCERSSRPLKITTCRCGSSRPPRLSTTRESARWRGKCRLPSPEFYAAKQSLSWASPLSRIPMICARRHRSR